MFAKKNFTSTLAAALTVAAIGLAARHSRRACRWSAARRCIRKEHRRERRQLEGPHHACRGGEGGRSRRDAAGAGPFTVFAPTNAAFAKLPAGTVETLLKPENKGTLTKVLTYHVVSGRYTADLMKMVKDGGGQAMLKTVEAKA